MADAVNGDLLAHRQLQRSGGRSDVDEIAVIENRAVDSGHDPIDRKPDTPAGATRPAQ